MGPAGIPSTFFSPCPKDLDFFSSSPPFLLLVCFHKHHSDLRSSSPVPVLFGLILVILGFFFFLSTEFLFRFPPSPRGFCVFVSQRTSSPFTFNRFSNCFPPFFYQWFLCFSPLQTPPGANSCNAKFLCLPRASSSTPLSLSRAEL